MAFGGSSEFCCPRLLDYFLVVGPQKHVEKRASPYKSAILKQYPPVDHEDFPLPIETVHFCQPDPLTHNEDHNYLSAVHKSFITFTLGRVIFFIYSH